MAINILAYIFNILKEINILLAADHLCIFMCKDKYTRQGSLFYDIYPFLDVDRIQEKQLISM